MFFKDTLKSPIGNLLLIADKTHLLVVSWEKNLKSFIKRLSINSFEKGANPILTQAKKQLKEYFLKKRTTFDLPLKFSGTEFQNKAWKTLMTINYGKTISYQAQAKLMRHPKACRATGSANGKNPLAVIVPCHRVITASNTLGGYSAGLKKKEFLLSLEQT